MHPDDVPEPLRHLIPWAERWGNGDDHERSVAVTSAAEDDLRLLVDTVDNADQESLYGWLEEPESYSQDLSPGYLAFTQLTMAADEARVHLRRTKGS